MASATGEWPNYRSAWDEWRPVRKATARRVSPVTYPALADARPLPRRHRRFFSRTTAITLVRVRSHFSCQPPISPGRARAHASPLAGAIPAVNLFGHPCRK